MAMVVYVSHLLLLSTHYSLLTTHCSLLTTHYYHSLLTTHCTAHDSPKVWAFSVSYFRNQYAIIDQKATFGQGEDGHPHLGPEQGCAAAPPWHAYVEMRAQHPYSPSTGTSPTRSHTHNHGPF